MTRDEMRVWQPDPNATVFELSYHYVGLGARTVVKCPDTARAAIRAFADDNRVQALTVTNLGEDGRPLPTDPQVMA